MEKLEPFPAWTWKRILLHLAYGSVLTHYFLGMALVKECQFWPYCWHLTFKYKHAIIRHHDKSIVVSSPFCSLLGRHCIVYACLSHVEIVAAGQAGHVGWTTFRNPGH
jgi:hypothetical protein